MSPNNRKRTGDVGRPGNRRTVDLVTVRVMISGR